MFLKSGNKMILYTIGKRIKNFIRVKVLSDFAIDKKRIINGDEYLKNKRSIKDGIVCWYYDNGKIKAECNYKNYVLEGISTYYYESGEVKAKENYKGNKLSGVSMRYFENGRLMNEETYKEGNLLYKRSFDEKGNMSVEKNNT